MDLKSKTSELSGSNIKKNLPENGGFLNFEQHDTNIHAYFVVNSKEYELRHFSTEFRQAIDHKGQPQQEVKGGLLSLTLYALPDDQINNWMMLSTQKHSGSIEFRRKSASSILRINFENATCINYVKELGNKELGLVVRLIISPEEVSFNDDVFHRNHWDQ